MKNKGKIGIGCLALLLVLIGVGVIKYYSWKHETERNLQKAEEYVVAVLHKKYDRDFLIARDHYIPNTGGYEFSVYPKEDKDFTFHAWLNGMTESGESDDYFMTQRFYGAVKMVRPFIDSISTDNYFSAAAVQPADLPDYKQMVASIHKHQYSDEQMLAKFPGKISIDLEIHINYNITSKNENSVLKKVYKLIEFLKAKKFGYIQISLFFYDFPRKNLKQIGKKEGVNFSKENLQKARKRIVLMPDNIKNIYNSRDLQQYVRNIIRSINNEH